MPSVASALAAQRTIPSRSARSLVESAAPRSGWQSDFMVLMESSGVRAN